MGGGENLAAWAEYLDLRGRWVRAAASCGLLGFALFVTLAIGISAQPRSWGWVGVAVPGSALGVWLLVAVARYSWLSLRVWTWPCPVCGGVFALSMWSAWPGDRCRRCGAQVVRADPGSA